MKDTTSYIHETLESLYSPDEIRSFIRLILSHVCRLSYNQQILCKDKQIPENEKNEIITIVNRLKVSEPLQYILGETEFYSIPLKVNPSVLIPRPETEELVDMIIKSSKVTSRKNRLPLRILDIGTGSGCIAITLAKHIPDADITAIDISDEALQTAIINANNNEVKIRFIHADILNISQATDIIQGKFDIIVSNPPYVMNEEKQFMNDNVLNYEPHNTLFVPDDNPLIFYEAIAEFAIHKLATDGMIYLEINALCDLITNDMLHKKGFTNTEINRDLSGKNRFVSAER